MKKAMRGLGKEIGKREKWRDREEWETEEKGVRDWNGRQKRCPKQGWFLKERKGEGERIEGEKEQSLLLKREFIGPFRQI